MNKSPKITTLLNKDIGVLSPPTSRSVSSFSITIFILGYPWKYWQSLSYTPKSTYYRLFRPSKTFETVPGYKRFNKEEVPHYVPQDVICVKPLSRSLYRRPPHVPRLYVTLWPFDNSTLGQHVVSLPLRVSSTSVGSVRVPDTNFFKSSKFNGFSLCCFSLPWQCLSSYFYLLN